MISTHVRSNLYEQVGHLPLSGEAGEFQTHRKMLGGGYTGEEEYPGVYIPRNVRQRAFTDVKCECCNTSILTRVDIIIFVVIVIFIIIAKIGITIVIACQ